MADSKISALTALAAAPAVGDLFVVVDISDTTMAASGTNKKITWANVTLALTDGTTTMATSQAQTFTNGLIANGNIGINTTPTSPLHVNKAFGAIGAATTEITTNIVATGTGNAAGTSGLRALTFSVTASGSNSMAELSAITGDALWSASAGTLASQAIMSANLRVTSGGGATIGYGYRVIALLSGAGSMTTYVGFEARSPSLTSTGTITTATGILINAQKSTGVTTGRGVWQAGASDINAFAGLTQFGSTSTPTVLVELSDTNAGTSAVQNALVVRSTNAGTPGTGFGVGIRAGLKSSTTADQDAGRLTWAWSTATHASRAAQGKLTAYYTTTEREAITWVADSTAVKIGLNGTSPAYMLDGLAPAGSQNILRLGQTGVSNGLQITSSGSALTYVMSDGKLGINATPTYYLDGVAPAGVQSIFRFGQTGVSNGFSVSSDGAALTYTMETGKLGVGVTSPQSILHAHDGSGGFLFVNRTGVSSTLVTVIPDGTGDVTERLHMFGWVSNSAGGFVSQVNETYLDVSSSTTKTDGSNTLTIAVTAAGAFTLQTTLGSATWKVLLWVFWR